MAIRQPKFSYWQDAPLPREQLVMFTSTLEERIPANHSVRLLDEILDTIDWTDWESGYVGNFGKPPIHPSVLCKVLLYALSRRIRSSRQIEYAVSHSIDFIWLVSGRTLDHTTISEFRRKHEAQLKDVYKQLVRLAISMGVAKLSELCIDGTKVQANSNRFKMYTRENVTKLLEQLDQQITSALSNMATNDTADDLFDDGQAADQLPSGLDDLQQRRAKLQDALTKVEQMEEQRRRDGIDNRKNPAQLPINDNDSRILPNKTGGYAPNYTPMTLTETTNGFIVCEEVLIGNVEHTRLIPMVEEVQQTYETQVSTVMGDGAYSTGPNLEEAQERGLELLSPIRQEATQAENPAYRDDLTQPVAAEDIPRLPINSTTKRFDRTAFVYNAQTDSYYCPAGKELRRQGTVEKIMISGVEAERKNYKCHQCMGCPLAQLCRINEDSTTGRKVGRDQYCEVRQRQAERMQEPENKTRYNKRQHYGEVAFAFIKSNLGIRRFLLRGHAQVQQEWRWACLTYNVKKLMTLWHAPRATSAEAEPTPTGC